MISAGLTPISLVSIMQKCAFGFIATRSEEAPFIWAMILAPILIIPIAIILVTVWFARVKKVKKWARLNNYTFNEIAKPDIREKFHEFAIFARKRLGIAKNVVTGAYDGLYFHVFDYGVGHESRDDNPYSHTYHGDYFSIVAVKPPLSFNYLFIIPKEIWDVRGGMFLRRGGIYGGMNADGIDEELSEIELEFQDFDKNFRVLTRDKEWAKLVMTDNLIRFLTSSPKYIIELKEEWIMLRRDKGFSPKNYEDALKFAQDLIRELSANPTLKKPEQA
jgi:hypothetical protein